MHGILKVGSYLLRFRIPCYSSLKVVFGDFSCNSRNVLYTYFSISLRRLKNEWNVIALFK